MRARWLLLGMLGLFGFTCLLGALSGDPRGLKDSVPWGVMLAVVWGIAYIGFRR